MVRGTIDLGKLPDLGVEPCVAQYVLGVGEWGRGFIAYGATKGAQVSAPCGPRRTAPSGPGCPSATGIRPGANVFAAVRTGGTTALLGKDTSINGPSLTVWRNPAA